MLDDINAFMNDNDRGPGHGIAQGLFYGFILLSLCVFPGWVMALALIGNHIRVVYQELWIERWKDRRNAISYGDFWYDILMRPLQTDVVACMGFAPREYWLIFIVAAFIIGFKKKNEWPLVVWWK
jgi:hypothetical protein